MATVNENTGEISAVAPGVTTITMTGDITGETQTINVTVEGAMYTVSFDSQGGETVSADVRVGADRTGTVAYLLEGLPGVPDEERYQEYSLTHLSGLYDRTRYYKQKSSTNNLKFVFMMNYVKTNADILTWYMPNPNADASLIAAFKTAMTTPQ